MNLLVTEPSQGVSHRERDDAYHTVIVRLNGSWRVIVCKDGIQWVLQFVKISRRGSNWRARSFHRSRDALIRVTANSAGEIQPNSMAVLEALPRMIGTGGVR